MKTNYLFRLKQPQSIATLIIVLFGLLTSQAGLAVSVRQADATATETYKSAKEEFTQAMKVVDSARQDYLDAKQKYQKTKSSADLKTTLEQAKAYVLRTDETMISYLELLNTKVEKTAGISDADRSLSLKEISDDIAWLKDQQVIIQAAETKDALKESATPVKQRWDEVKARVKKITGRVLAAHLNYTLTRFTNLEPKIEDRIAAAKSKGKDTGKLEELFAAYQSNLDEAEQIYDTAKARFDQISNLQEADALYQDGRAKIKDYNQLVRSAHKSLKEIVKELNAQK